MQKTIFLLISLFGVGCLTWSTYEPANESTADAATDDSNDTNVWWDRSWGERRVISIPSDLTPAPLTDVPIFVPTSVGEPVRFIASGDVLSHEWDEEGYWVKVPIVDSQGATIELYSENESAEAAPRPADVWSNGYVAVWHFAEELIDTGAGGQPYYEDSVAQRRIVQNEAFAFSHQDEGYIGQCLYVRDELESDFEATDLGSVFPQEALTVEIWHKFRPAGLTNRRIFGAGDPAFVIEMSDGGMRVAAQGDSSRFVQWDPEVDTWTKMTAVLGPVDPRRTIKVYLNDDSPMESIPLSIDWRPTNQFYFIGTRSTLDFRYDELRLSDVARSDDWVRFQARVEAKPSPIVVGEVETL